jgi:elongation factor Ts
LNQPYVKENKTTVEKHVADTAKHLGGTIEAKGFIRYEKGEGIEKKDENFADEIAKLVK